MQNLQKEFTGKGVVWLTIDSNAPGTERNLTPEEAQKIATSWKTHETALLLERGDVKEAISNLEAGKTLTPESDYIHYQLAMAYRRDSRNEEAQRELRLYQTLKNHNRGRDVPESN